MSDTTELKLRSKHCCGTCKHWSVKGSAEQMDAYRDEQLNAWGIEPTEDKRWRYCATVWQDRLKVGLSNYDFLCEDYARGWPAGIPSPESAEKPKSEELEDA